LIEPVTDKQRQLVWKLFDAYEVEALGVDQEFCVTQDDFEVRRRERDRWRRKLEEAFGTR
jgi:hypothetical protein